MSLAADRRPGPPGAAPAVPGRPPLGANGRLRLRATEALGSIQLLDFVVGALLIVRTAVPFVPFPLPVSDTAMLAFTAWACFRRPRHRAPQIAWFGVAWLLMLVYLVGVSSLQDIDFARRGLRIAALILFALFIAQGRVHLPSLAAGLLTALTVNVPLFYLRIAPDDYGGVLTGYLADKNVAGLYYSVFALFLLGVVRSRRARIAIVLIGLVFVFLTGSRTSTAGYVFGLLWLYGTAAMPLLFRLGAAGGVVWLFSYLEENFARVGPFADRAGSDHLRERIDAATQAKVSVTPWYGQGLGEATVYMEGNDWFFHNAYLGLFVEGGFPFLVVVLALVLWVMFLSRRTPLRTFQRRSLEACGFAMVLSADRLGEVFISIPAFVLFGYGLLLMVREEREGIREAGPQRMGVLL